MNFDFVGMATKVAAVFKQFPISSVALTIVGLAVIGGFIFLYSQTITGIPIAVSLIQQRYFGNYAGFPAQNKEDDAQIYSYGEVTITNTSTDKKVALDIFLLITSKDPAKKNMLIRRAANLRGPWNFTYGKDDVAAQKGHSAPLFMNPVELKAGEIARKELVFIFSDMREHIYPIVAKESDYNFAVEINDLISGHSIEINLPGKYRG